MNTKKTTKIVLIVEDESIVAEDIRITLEGMGYSVIDIVNSGDGALKAIKKEKPDVIIMDIRIKGDIDGIETAGKIEKQDIPIIFLTGYGDEKTVDRAKGAGPYAIIHKPYSEKELHSSVEIAIYKHSVDTKIKKKNKELEDFNNLALNREKKMVELKDEVNRLKKKLEEK